MRVTRNRAARILALGTTAALTLVLAACGLTPDPSPSATHPSVTITVGDWGNSGITDDAAGESLESLYEATHPWVDLRVISGDYTEHHELLTQSLDYSPEPFSVAVVDEGYITGFVAQSENFVNLLDLGAGIYEEEYLPWKWQEAANADGSVVIGLGADVGGMALCYRKDLFEAAGLPSDREAVSAAVGDSWDDFIAVGRAYGAGSGGKKFIDNATNVMNPALMQLGTGLAYYDRDDVLDMENVKPAFYAALDVIDAGLSHAFGGDNYHFIGPWSPEWNAGFTNGDFAVTLCPSWMLDYIETQVAADPSFTGQWDVADIPGPGGNWGGTFYTIPQQGTEHEQQEAYNFLEWLIQPEQQLKIMAETGNLPSQTALLQSEEVAALTNPFFNDAPYGQIFAKTVLDLPSEIYYTPKNRNVRVAVESVLNGVQSGILVAVDPWAAAVAAAEAVDECPWTWEWSWPGCQS